MAVEQYEPRIALALTPSFVADINRQPESGNPGLSPDLAANSVTLMTSSGPAQVFSADDGAHGRELWTTNGTPEGTHLLADIWPGPTGSLPTSLFAVGGRVYFAANDGMHGCELWQTDGTAAGTRLVKDIALPPNPGPDEAVTASDPAGFAALADGTVLFAASGDDPVSHVRVRQLWRTDGTDAGTVPVGADDASVPLDPTMLTAFGTNVLFGANDKSGNPVLWITGGTAANTKRVFGTVRENSAPIADPRHFTVFDGPDVASPFVLFTADDGAGGRAIWRYDTANGPRLVTPGGGSITEMVRFGSIAVFAGDDGDGTGPRLWRTSGGEGDTSTIKVYDSPSDRPVTNPALLTVSAKKLFFVADGIRGERSLWTSDGTDFGTFRYPSNLVGVRNLVARGGEVFFVNDDGTSLELWRSYPQDPELGLRVSIIREIDPAADAFPDGFLNAAVLNGELLFAAADGVHGTELWKSDGTADGTVLLEDVNPATADGIDAFINGDASYLSAATIGTTFYFAADDGVHGTELWKRAGDSAPVLVADLEPGATGSRPAQLTVVGGLLYFTTTFASKNGPDTYALWVLDTGSAAGPMRLNGDVASSEFTDEQARVSHHLMPIGNKLLFAAADGAAGMELWITDGTLPGTSRLKDINPAAQTGSFPAGFAAVGSSVVFAADNGAVGRELWITDGTSPGTTLLKDIFAGAEATSGVARSSAPGWLTSVAGVVYFSADDGVNGRELWVTDGTDRGTRMVKNINTRTAPPNPSTSFVPTGSDPHGFTALGSSVLFAADDGQHGTELWTTNGMADGTTLVKDINTVVAPDSGGGIGGSFPVRLTAAGGKIFFAADDGVNRRRLWVTDGTNAGTSSIPLDGLVDASPNVGNLVVAGGQVFFTALKSGQRVLLETDGTLPGTAVVEFGPGFSAGFAGFDAVALAGNDRRLYFGVNDGRRGKELWQIDFPVPPAPVVLAVGTDGRSTSWDQEFAYTLVNPTTIRVAGLTAIQSGFFSAKVPLTVTPAGGLTTAVTKVASGRYDARSRSVLVTLTSPVPAAPTTGTLVVGLPAQPGARLIDASTGDVVRAFSSEELEAAGYSAAFATRFQGGLRVAAGDVDGDGHGDLAVAPGGVPDQADPAQPGRKLAAIFGGSQSRVAIFDGAPTPSWQPVSIDVAAVFGADGAGGYLVALGDVRADAKGSGVRELIVAAGRKVAVFDVLLAAEGSQPVVDPVPVRMVTTASGAITSLAVGHLLGERDDIIVATNTATGTTAGSTTVSILDGTTLGTLRSFVVAANVESGPARNLVNIFGLGASVTVGDFDGNSTIDLALGAGANGLGNFRVIGGEFIASAVWFTDKARYQAAIARQLGDTGTFSQVRPLVGSRWQPRVGPDVFSPLAAKEPLGGGFNAPVSVVAVADGTGRAKLFAALGSMNQSGNAVRRFTFAGAAERWSNDAAFEMRPQSPGKPQIRAGIGLRLG